MNYVRCINNKAYLHHKGEPPVDDVTDLTIGHIYKLLPLTEAEKALGQIRVIDNTGEDYLFPASYFEPVEAGNGPVTGVSEALTVHLDPILKGILRAEALAAKKPMSALLRQWIDERLDLPERAPA
ncbi:MAG: hypothetical protein U0350_33420 [Caldilineaceae bacterium]